MNPELQQLKLFERELEELSGRQNLTLNVEQFLQLYQVYEKSPELFLDIQTKNLVVRPSMLKNADLQEKLSQQLQQKNLGKKGWLGKGLNTLTKNIEKKIEKYLRSFQPCPLGVLLDEVERYNAVIDEIAFVDRLQEVGNPVKIQDRQYIIERLHQIRAELVRAIKTEKLFRENPKMNMNDLLFNLYSWQRLELDEQAQKYERFVNEALDIGVSVWEEMRLWYFVEDNKHANNESLKGVNE